MDKELWQVTICFGNFENREEAVRFRNKISVNEGPEYISSEIKGSFH